MAITDWDEVDEEDVLEWDTYEGWKENGYHVIEGQKSHKRDSRGPLFSDEQVEEEQLHSGSGGQW
jgi:hypothetical protein